MLIWIYVSLKISVIGPIFPLLIIYLSIEVTGNINVAGHIMSSVDSSANLILRRTTASLAGAQTLGAIKFAGTDASNNDDTYGQIIGKTNTTTSGSEESEIELDKSRIQKII